MSCKKIEERLLDDDQAFLDRAVREHLKDCPACSRLYEELEEIEELHRSLARSARAPLDFTGQVIIDCQVAEEVWQEVTIGDFEDGKVELEDRVGRLDVPALEKQLAGAEALIH